MALLRPTVWTQQPQQAAHIDWSNPITRGMVDAWLGSNLATRSVFGRSPIYTSPVALSVTKDGIGASATTGSVRYDVGDWAEAGPYSCVSMVNVVASGDASIVRKDGASTPVQAYSSNLRAINWSGLAANNYYSSLTPKKCLLVSNRTSVSNCDLWADGTKFASQTSLSSYGSTANPLCFLGTEGNGELFTSNKGSLVFVAIWNRALSDSEIKSISANPWQIFKPIPRRIFAEAGAGGGGVTITTNLGTATASGLTATLTQASTLIATQGTATASGLSATLAQAFTLSGNRGTATASGAQATIAQAATISANLGTATASGLNASITAAGNVTISCNLGTATAAGRQANIGANVTVSASLGAATAAGYTAALEIAFTLAANRGTASATGKTATIYANDAIACAVGQAIASGYAALISEGGIYASAPSGNGPVLINQNMSRPMQANTSRLNQAIMSRPSNAGGRRH